MKFNQKPITISFRNQFQKRENHLSQFSSFSSSLVVSFSLGAFVVFLSEVDDDDLPKFLSLFLLNPLFDSLAFPFHFFPRDIF